MTTKLSLFPNIFSGSKSVPNFKYLCNSIPELCNVFEDQAQHMHTIEFYLSCFI